MSLSAVRPPALWAMLLALLIAPAAHAQAPAPTDAGAVATPGSELVIYHVTMGPGDEVYEKFEHNAIWVHDPVRGTDHVYNYGAFDFNQPGYWGRFVKGDWLYWLDVSDIWRTVYVYQEILNRTVSVQELNLTPAQRAEIRDFLEWNAREENRYYYYDYYYDNCSTRIRDAIDRVIGGRLRAATQDSLTDKSFRWHSERLVADDRGAYTGLLVGLGPGADRPITAWEEMFLPGKVQEQLRRVMVPDEAGNLVPLVRAEHVLFEADRAPVRAEPPRWLLWYLAFGVALGAVFAGLGWMASRSRAARFGLAALGGVWALFVGTGGVLLAGLWAFTNHTIAHGNENLFHLNPLWLPLVVLVPAFAYGARWAARPAYWLVAGMVALSLLGLLTGLLPWFVQVNGELIALVLPAHLGLGWAVYHLYGVGTGKSGTSAAAPAPAGRRRRSVPVN